SPRIAHRLLRWMRVFALVAGYDFITAGTVSFGLRMLKVVQAGLDEQDRDIFRSLILKFKGGHVGVETLAISVGETADSLEDFYEPYLILKGLIERTSRGRKATDFAYFHLNLKKNDSLNGEQHGYQRVLF
ncbi:Holliday junction branch migration DNA helicase RuvB, partial [Pseudomonas aeruginosa]|nr:Holliday junction branch migration DNA helicase RuvB [Pseudomonas aeruginosa]